MPLGPHVSHIFSWEESNNSKQHLRKVQHGQVSILGKCNPEFRYGMESLPDKEFLNCLKCMYNWGIEVASVSPHVLFNDNNSLGRWSLDLLSCELWRELCYRVNVLSITWQVNVIGPLLSHLSDHLDPLLRSFAEQLRNFLLKGLANATDGMREIMWLNRWHAIGMVGSCV